MLLLQELLLSMPQNEAFKYCGVLCVSGLGALSAIIIAQKLAH
jgi:hypothetical protein